MHLPKPCAGHHDQSVFQEAVEDAYASIQRILGRNALKLLNKVLDSVGYPTYLKNSRGQVLLVNADYRNVFGYRGDCIGRIGKDFLDSTIREVSEHSDAMILSGCDKCDFFHRGKDSTNRTVLFHTIKHSLIGSGSEFAILGVSTIAEVLEDQSADSIRFRLQDSWEIIKRLDDLDLAIAKLMSHGESTPSISEKVSLSSRSVEQRRRHILTTLKLDSPIGLTRLLVRLQDAGFCDFGQ